MILPNYFMIKQDLKGAYFSIPVHPSHQSFLSFMWKKKNLPVHLSAFRALKCPSYFHQGDEAFSGLSQITRYLSSNLSRQHADSSSDKKGASEMEISSLGSTGKPHIPYQLPEIRVRANSVTGIPQQHKSQTTATDLPHLIRVFTLTLPAILSAPLHYRGLQ